MSGHHGYFLHLVENINHKLHLVSGSLAIAYPTCVPQTCLANMNHCQPWTWATRIGLSIALLFSTAVGLYLLQVVFAYLKREPKDRPINKLLFYDFCIHSLGGLTNINVSLCLLSPIPLGELFGTQFCVGIGLISIFQTAHLSMGSCAIALYRVLMLSTKRIVIKNDQMFLALCMMVFSVFIDSIIALKTMYPHGENQLFLRICRGHMSLKSNNGSMEEFKIQPISSIAFLVSNFIEFVCYIVCFSNIVLHDNFRAKKVLTLNSIKKRNRKNVITAFGQFLTWLNEMVFNVLVTVLLVVSKVSGDDIELAFIIKKIDFFLHTCLFIFCVPKLRKSFLHTIGAKFKLILNIFGYQSHHGITSVIQKNTN